MPSKTETTTRKHGTKTRIRLYADEVRTLLRAKQVLKELQALGPDDYGPAIDTLDIVATTYGNYESNGTDAE